MSAQSLNALFRPNAVAVIGASPDPRHVGAVIMANLLGGTFLGPVMPVHPSLETISGVAAYRSVETLPVTPDLAVICTDPPGRARVPARTRPPGRGCGRGPASRLCQAAPGPQTRTPGPDAGGGRALGHPHPGAERPGTGGPRHRPQLLPGHLPGPAPAAWPLFPSPPRFSPPSSTGPEPRGSGFPTSCPWATGWTCATATCWTTWPRTRGRVPYCSMWRPSPMPGLF